MATIGTGEVDSAASTVTFTLQNVRRFVLIRAARRGLYPTVEEIDQAIQSTLNEAYNARRWRFRRLLVRLTLAADNALTIKKRDGSNDWTALAANQKFDMVSTRALYFDADTAERSTWARVTTDHVKFGTADEFARLTAGDAGDTGRPQRFRIEGSSSGSYTWHFWPFPDAAYTMYAEIFLEGPQAALGDTSFDEFPPAFRTVLRDSVLLRVLEDRGAADRDLRERVMHAQSQLLAEFEDVPGGADDLGGPEDVYGDVAGGMIGGPL